MKIKRGAVKEMEIDAKPAKIETNCLSVESVDIKRRSKRLHAPRKRYDDDISTPIEKKKQRRTKSTFPLSLETKVFDLRAVFEPTPSTTAQSELNPPESKGLAHKTESTAPRKPRQYQRRYRAGQDPREKTFVCTYEGCQERFPTFVDRNLHRIAKHDPTVFCDRCGREFKKAGHMYSHHCITCNICNKVFQEKFRYNKHHCITRLNNPFKCSMCDRTFAIESSMHAHEKKCALLEPGSRNQAATVRMKCFKCETVCFSHFDLAAHFESEHGHKNDLEDREFINADAMKKFMQDLTLETNYRYRISKHPRLSDGTRTYVYTYKCQSERQLPRTNRRQTLKRKPWGKLNPYYNRPCTGYAYGYEREDGTISFKINYAHTHPPTFGWQVMTKEQKAEIIRLFEQTQNCYIVGDIFKARASNQSNRSGMKFIGYKDIMRVLYREGLHGQCQYQHRYWGSSTRNQVRKASSPYYNKYLKATQQHRIEQEEAIAQTMINDQAHYSDDVTFVKGEIDIEIHPLTVDADEEQFIEVVQEQPPLQDEDKNTIRHVITRMQQVLAANMILSDEERDIITNMAQNADQLFRNLYPHLV